MPKYIAFLRAINVGGHTVKMDVLRALFEELGLTNVETFIASGNVLFDSASRSPAALERKIGAHLHSKLGYTVATMIRTPAELAQIAAAQPFEDRDLEAPSLYIAFLAAAPAAEARQKLLAYPSDIDEFHVAGREVHWRCWKKINESQFSGALLEKTLGVPATVRNVNTVRKLAAKFA